MTDSPGARARSVHQDRVKSSVGKWQRLFGVVLKHIDRFMSQLAAIFGQKFDPRSRQIAGDDGSRFPHSFRDQSRLPAR